MRILFFLHNISRTRHFDSVLAALAERGHCVILAAENRSRDKLFVLPKSANRVNRRLAARNLRGRIELVSCPVRRTDEWAQVAPTLRRARDYVRFMDPRYQHADKLRRRSAAHAPQGWPGFLDARPWLQKRRRALARALSLAEDVIPSDARFEDFIRSEKPDLVLVTPLVDYGSYQTDYVKSAHRLGLPVGFLPFSWDNLTNRGIIRVQPDRVLVWNEMQKAEAVDLHHVPPDRVVVTGAPRFDQFFVMTPSTTREHFCHNIGLDPAQRLLLYVCSSEFVAPLEIEFVRRWVAGVRSAADPSVRSASILVRPHPAHLKPWDGVTLSEFPNAVRWFSHETLNADQGLYDSLFHSNAVVGLNTSAMIEAGILGKPVHTILAKEFAGGQEQTLHFGYLRASHGGLLHEAGCLDEHVRQLASAIQACPEGTQERRFVERFVRPHGIDRPVTPLMVEEIERMGEIIKRPQRGTPLWHRPVRWGLLTAFNRTAL
jgi:hypothetical protein